MGDTNNNEMNGFTAILGIVMIFLIFGFISKEVIPWIGHKLTVYPVVDKQKIISEVRYCVSKDIAINILDGNTTEHDFIPAKSHIANPNYQPEKFAKAYIDDYANATLTNDGQNCTLTLNNKPTK